GALLPRLARFGLHLTRLGLHLTRLGSHLTRLGSHLTRFGNLSRRPALLNGVEVSMTRAQTTVGATLLACFAWIGAYQAHAASSTQAGNAGTITLNWEATQDKTGRPLIVGTVVTNGGKTGYCIP